MRILNYNADLAVSKYAHKHNLEHIVYSNDKSRFQTIENNFHTEKTEYMVGSLHGLHHLDIENDIIIATLKNSAQQKGRVIANHINKTLPSFVIIETSAKFSAYSIQETIFEIIDKDYDFIEFKYNACEFGLAQNRELKYIIFHRKDVQPHFNITPSRKDTKLIDIMHKHVHSDYYVEGMFTPQSCSRAKAKSKLLGYLNSDGEPNKNTKSSRVYDPNYKSVHLQEKSGGNGFATGIYKTEFGYRTLTPLECQHLQGIQEINFKISDTSQYNLINTSIVYPIIEQILNNIRLFSNLR